MFSVLTNFSKREKIGQCKKIKNSDLYFSRFFQRHNGIKNFVEKNFRMSLAE